MKTRYTFGILILLVVLMQGCGTPTPELVTETLQPTPLTEDMPPLGDYVAIDQPFWPAASLYLQSNVPLPVVVSATSPDGLTNVDVSAQYQDEDEQLIHSKEFPQQPKTTVAKVEFEWVPPQPGMVVMRARGYTLGNKVIESLEVKLLVDILEWPEPSEVKDWLTFTNDEYNFQIKYPPTWYVNEGTFGPPPPMTTKFSTYQVTGELRALNDQDAEVWIGVSEEPSTAEMRSLEEKSYMRTGVFVAGQNALRYIAPSPQHGIYDVVYLQTDSYEYRIHLSAATHDFDSTFELFLATFEVTE